MTLFGDLALPPVAWLPGIGLSMLTGWLLTELIRRIPPWLEWQFAGSQGPSPLLAGETARGHAVLTQALTALALAAAVLRFDQGSAMAAAAMVSLWLIPLAIIDHETRLLPDCLTLSGLWLGLLFAVQTSLIAPAAAILGAAGGYLLLRLPDVLYLWLTGRSGMGGGDCKLLAMLGAWLGPAALAPILVLAAGGGATVALIAIARGKRSRRETMAFGPWLAMAGWLTLLWGPSWTPG